MRFDCTGKSKKQWHLWFAWKPVQVSDGSCRWLEYVYRRGEFFEYWGDCWWKWEYGPASG